jgi:hypothetical protein
MHRMVALDPETAISILNGATFGVLALYAAAAAIDSRASAAMTDCFMARLLVVKVHGKGGHANDSDAV